jgi:hypothetical protein
MDLEDPDLDQDQDVETVVIVNIWTSLTFGHR